MRAAGKLIQVCIVTDAKGCLTHFLDALMYRGGILSLNSRLKVERVQIAGVSLDSLVYTSIGIELRSDAHRY